MPGHEPGHEQGQGHEPGQGHDQHGRGGGVGADDGSDERSSDRSAQHRGHGWEVVEGVDATEFWEGYYGATEQVHSGRANSVLVDVAAPLAPGTALDLGCGEGGDAVWLAGRGWRVTAVDVSGVALGRGAAAAAAAGVGDRVTWEQHDLGATFPAGRFDLVSAHYLHTPTSLDRDRVLRDAAAAVGPGGLLLVVGHLDDHGARDHDGPHDDADDGGLTGQDGHGGHGGHGGQDGHGGHGGHGRTLVALPGPEQVLAELALDPAQWTVERCGAFPQTRTAPDGSRWELVDGVLAVRRT